MQQTAEKTNIIKEDFKLKEIITEARPSVEISKDRLVFGLNALLSDEFTVFTKTLNFHWNVEGPRFNSIHEFLECQYKELLGIADNVAERIRMLGAYPSGTLNEFKEITKVLEHPGQHPETPTMLIQLQIDHEKIQKSIKKMLDKSEGFQADPGTEDFLVGILRQHEDMSWRLKSHLS